MHQSFKFAEKLSTPIGVRFQAKSIPMKTTMTIVMSILAAVICTSSFAAEKQTCKKSRKNCPMNNKKECNCGKDCGC
jgi:hypothetical protein